MKNRHWMMKMYRIKKHRPYYHFPSWLKWVLIGIIVCIIGALIYGSYLYNVTQKRKESGFDKSKEIVKEELNIKTITSIDYFQGEMLYHIITGETKENEHVIVFLPIADKKPLIIKQKDVLAKSEIKSSWRTACKNCEFIKINPAIEEDKALWEITFIDEKERYVLEYVSIQDGSPYEQLQLKQRFQ